MSRSKPRVIVRADVMRRVITEQNLTEAEAAEQIGIDRVTLSRWLRGRASPTARARRRVLASPLFAPLTYRDLFVTEVAA